MGASVSSAGDINGDGFDDLIVGAPYANAYFDGTYTYFFGASYVVFGKVSGFDAAMDLSSLDGSDGFSLTDRKFTQFVGRSVSSAGDVNGDGFDDVIVSAAELDYVIFGKASGFDATLHLSSLNGSNGFLLSGGGYSVSSTGDINGDGFDDVLVGAYRADPNGTDSGSSYVVFGKTSAFDATLHLSSLNDSDGFRLDGVTASDFSGSSVGGAGDVNGDGFDDLIVGAPYADSNGDRSGSSYVIFGGNFTGEAVYLGTPGDDNLVGTSTAERFEAGDGNDHMTGLGGSDVFHGGSGNDTIVIGADFDFKLVDGGTGTDTLEFAGNLNLADFHDTIKSIETIDLISSSDFNNTLTLTLPDLLSLSDTTDTFTVNGDAGDRVNGLKDGWEDGGIDGNYHIYTNQGTVLRVDTVVSTDRPNAAVISLADLDGSNGFRLNGATHDDSGSSVSSAGDVNGDGFDDVIIEADDLSYVVFGKAVGFGATLDLSSLNGSNGFRLDGAASNFFGSSVSNAGDVNGDGFDDLIVGADRADPNGSFSGSSYVVFGKASGFDATLDLSSLDGSNGFSLDGVAANDLSGFSVSSAGDVNGDGFDDVIVGAYGADPNGKNSGSSYVVLGKASGFDATLDLSSLDGSNGFRLDGMAKSDYSGRSVSNAGDVNGDGFDDVIIGALFADPNGLSSGSSYVVFGKASGFSAALDLSSLDGSNGFRLEGVAADDFSGTSVSNAGDVNGDGFDDVIVSSPLGKL